MKSISSLKLLKAHFLRLTKSNFNGQAFQACRDSLTGCIKYLNLLRLYKIGEQMRFNSDKKKDRLINIRVYHKNFLTTFRVLCCNLMKLIKE